MKVKVCVIGIGGIGLHHANSCAKAGYSLIGIDIIEIENIGFPVYKNFSEIIEKEIDIFIISTTSKFHFYYLKKIYQNFRNSKVLIEKPLFSSLEEYKEFSGFKSDFKDKVFINLPFIYADTFAEIRSSRNGELEGYKVEGGNWGLGCNLLHDLAIIHYLGGALSPLEHVEATINQVVESKRKGYSEVFGQLRFKINNVIVDLMSSKNLVGKKAVVTIPNFGFWKVRLHLLLKGTMPITKNLPDEWYNTPNLHMCTLKDFYNFCENRNIKLDQSIALKNDKISTINKLNLNIKNLSAELGIFLIER